MVNLITWTDGQKILKSIYSEQDVSMVKAEKLMAASIEFIAREEWAHASFCNNRAISILEHLTDKLKSNKEFLKDKLNN